MDKGSLRNKKRSFGAILTKSPMPRLRKRSSILSSQWINQIIYSNLQVSTIIQGIPLVHQFKDQVSRESPTHRHGSWRLFVLQLDPTMPRYPLIKPRHGHQLCLSTLRHGNPRICVDRHSSAPEASINHA
ncbi:hypothetical protein PIB30_054081 [Stylosanthes scabra]|uniref:Uncharacterized protein n=1 Tax=Stylosanthes scabra TaxID=79078 RepID=A0ABU6YHZ3_9FABA|nr:hypothetical protein [Stylosanthes scabra]